jgi:cytidylate kinase
MTAAGTICISHATGARGAEVARSVAEQLGLRYADEDVIAEAAEWADLDPAFVADAERRKPLLARILGSMSAQSTPRLPPGDVARALPSDADLRALITSAVTSLAREGGVVIVAHAASFAIGSGDATRVFVTASPSTRAERLAGERGIGAREAERVLRDEDAGRADYLKRFYGIDAELPSHYDLVVNTDALGVDGASRLVLEAASLS